LVQQGCARGSTQHSCFHTILIWPDDLRWEEPGVEGDADTALLGAAAVPILEGSWVRLRGMGGKDPGLVRGAPRTFDGQCFGQGMNDPRTHARAVVYLSQPRVL